MANAPVPAINLFYCYAHADTILYEELDKHLELLKRTQQIKTWSKHMINPGREWKQETEYQLNKAQIILLLISPDFIASHECYEKEMMLALQRHEAGEAHILPILLRHVDLEGVLFRNLQMLPKNGKPLADWRDRDLFFVHLVTEIRRIISSLHGEYIAESKSNTVPSDESAKKVPPPHSHPSSSSGKHTIQANKIGAVIDTNTGKYTIQANKIGAVIDTNTGTIDIHSF